MKSTRVTPFILLFASVAFSQTGGKQFSSQSQASCPAELKATLWVAGKTVPVVPVANAPAKKSDRWLKITLSNPNSEIVAAKFTVHGFPLGLRYDPAVFYLENDPNEIRKTITFDGNVAPGKDGSIEAPVQDFSTVTAIDLEEVTYSDGSSWHPANNREFCRAVGMPVDTATYTLTR